MKTTNIKFIEYQKEAKKPKKFYWSLGSILVGIFLGMIILTAVTGNVNATSIFFSQLYLANFGSVTNIGWLFGTLSWMLFLGLAMVVSFRARQFNIGISAQMVGGGIAGYLFAFSFDMGRGGAIFSVLIPMFVGISIAWLIGWLKIKFRINEVISSIMINWSVFWIYKYITNSSYDWAWYGFGDTTSKSINASNSLRAPWLTNAFGGSDVNIMFILALVIIVTFVLIYAYSKWGIKQKILGSSPTVATYAGIKKNREIMKAYIISGALAGLAGSAYYLGVKQNLPTIGSDLPLEAFYGISIALIGFNSPIGALASATFISMMQTAKPAIQSSVGSSNSFIVDVVIAIIIWTVSLTNFFIIYKPQQKWKIFNRSLKQKVAINELIANSNNSIESISSMNDFSKKYANIKVNWDIDSNDIEKVLSKLYKANILIIFPENINLTQQLKLEYANKLTSTLEKKLFKIKKPLLFENEFNFSVKNIKGGDE